MWVAERDACDDCLKCQYYLHEFWNCQGAEEKCWEFTLSIYERMRLENESNERKNEE